MLAVVLVAALGCQQSQSGSSSEATPSTEATSAPATTGQPESGQSPGGEEVTLPNGLKYEDLRVGEGALAEAGKTASVHYTGWLTDGTKFDSSLDRGQPYDFQIGASQVIPGWDEGVKGMKVGGKRKLTIPPDLGYGARGAGGVIPPNATLVFEVELLGVR
jgi:FKBP-type peptidyl-prolyl cis-trans isomerase